MFLTFFSRTNDGFVTFTPYCRARGRGEDNGADFRVLFGFECVNSHSVLAGEKQTSEVDEIFLNKTNKQTNKKG